MSPASPLELTPLVSWREKWLQMYKDFAVHLLSFHIARGSSLDSVLASEIIGKNSFRSIPASFDAATEQEYNATVR